MKPASKHLPDLPATSSADGFDLIEGRGGALTLRVGSIYLHSRYDPREEARRLVASAGLSKERPVMVVGLGLGYQVLELLEQGYQVAATEPDSAVARAALEHVLPGADFLLGIGDPDAVASTARFREIARQLPQVLVHPATARLHPGYAEAITAKLSACALSSERLNIAVVGPAFGGSLPIAGYLADAFRGLGHNTLLVDNGCAWELYERVTGSVENPQASRQLGDLFSNLLSQWSYARVAEFNPEICIVLAQAPVGPDFPSRLAKKGIVSAFWFVENWRHMPYWKQVAPQYDSFFHLQPGEFEAKLEEAGCRHHEFLQTGCAPALHRPVELDAAEREEFGCEISFAGAGYRNRLELFRGLTDYDFKLWGVGWRDRLLTPLVVGGEKRFDSETFMKVVAGTAVNLNLHSSTTHRGVNPNCDALNPRIFEIAAAGAFQLCDPCIGLDRHFDPGDEVPVYRNLQDLREKIDYYLKHPEERKACAERARDRALRDHSYEQRARQMLDHIFSRHGSRILKRGVRVQRTTGEMAARLGEGDELGVWLATLPDDAPFTREGLRTLLPRRWDEMAPPERLLAYMNEVFEFAEKLLKEPR